MNALLSIHKIEINSLKKKMDNTGSVDRLIEVENKLRDKERENSNLNKEIRSLQKIKKDLTKEVEKLQDESQYPNKVFNFILLED